MWIQLQVEEITAVSIVNLTSIMNRRKDCGLIFPVGDPGYISLFMVTKEKTTTNRSDFQAGAHLG
jgi:hypothetical protein